MLDQVLDNRLTLVCAGSGYGKTTLLATLPARDVPTVWYGLGRSDADPAVLLSYLTLGIATMLGPAAHAQINPLPSRVRTRPDLEAYANHLANVLLRAGDRDLIIVFDDYHLVARSKALTALIDHLITVVPPNVHIVIASRTHVSIPSLPKLRASGQVLDIGQDELRCSREEAAELIERDSALRLPAPILDVLIEKTEGWPICLQLIGQMLRNRPPTDVADFLQHFASSQRPLFEYLAREVLLQQPSHLQEFLLRSSVLTCLDAETCDAVLGRDDSRQILEWLRQHNLVAASMDGSSFRCHQLIRDFLRQRLSEDRRAYVAAHKASADHFRHVGNEELAIHHYIMAELFSVAASLISRVSEAMLRVSRFDTVVFWIEQLPSGTLESFPDLLVRRAEIDEIRGRYESATRWYDWAATVYRQRNDLLGLSRVLRSKGRMNWGVGQPENAERLHSEALSYLSAEHQAERAAILCDLARDRLSSGAPASSFTLWREALQVYEDLGDKEGQLATLINPGAWLHFDRGDFAGGIALLHKAAALARELGSKHQLAECYNTLSAHCFLWGRVEEAYSYALEALELSRALNCDLSEAFALMNLANVTCDVAPDRLEDAVARYKRALGIFELAGNHRFAVVTLAFMSTALRRQGNALEAVRLGRRALALAKVTTACWITAFAQLCLAAALLDTSPNEARPLLQEAIETFRGYDDKYNLTFAFFCLAVWARRTSNRQWAQYVHQCLRHAREGSYDYIFRREAAHAAPLLLDALEAGVEVDYVCELLPALGQAPCDRVISLLAHHDHALRRQAIRILGRLGGAEAQAALRKASRSPFEAIRQEACAALLRFSPPPHVPLEIRCFGSFSVRRGAVLIPDDAWKRKKVRSLLEYLASSPNLCATKDEIADAFWPDFDPAAAQNNFYRTLHHLRRVLDPAFEPPHSSYVLFEGGTVRLNDQAVAMVDIVDFQHYLAEARAAALADHLDAAAVCWRAAVELYRGDFLADDLYDDWTEPRRERFREEYVATLLKLGDHWARRENWDSAADCLRRILVIDPTREEIHLRLMSFLARAGNRVEALHQYRRCEKILRRELEAEPMPETKEYYRKLLAGAR